MPFCHALIQDLARSPSLSFLLSAFCLGFLAKWGLPSMRRKDGVLSALPPCPPQPKVERVAHLPKQIHTLPDSSNPFAPGNSSSTLDLKRQYDVSVQSFIFCHTHHPPSSSGVTSTIGNPPLVPSPNLPSHRKLHFEPPVKHLKYGHFRRSRRTLGPRQHVRRDQVLSAAVGTEAGSLPLPSLLRLSPSPTRI